MAFSLSAWSPWVNHWERGWAYNESVSQVRFAPELLKDPDPTGVDTPVRWKWQCSKSNMSHRWARLVSSANEVKKYGHFVAHEDQVFFPQMVSCFWRDTWSLKALAVIPTCHLRNVCSCRKKTGRFYRQKFNHIFIYLSGNNCMWFLSPSLWFPKYANMSTMNLYYFSSWKNVIEKRDEWNIQKRQNV